MSTSSPSTSYVEPDELVNLLREPGVAVIDVRGEDFAEGHIVGAENVPSEQFVDQSTIDDLVHRLSDKETVVFHCMKSQVRGPTCADRYFERLAAVNPGASQQVKVLKGGFQNWQELYGDDQSLTEH